MHGPTSVVWANLTPFSLQSLGIINDMASGGSAAVKHAVAAACAAGVEAATDYACEDHPQHGDKPQRLVRAKAAECLAFLQSAAAAADGAVHCQFGGKKGFVAVRLALALLFQRLGLFQITFESIQYAGSYEGCARE